MLTNHSPAKIIRELLIALGLGQRAPVEPWPVYALSEPEAPDNVLTVFNTTGVDHGRIMATGERDTHEGIQIRVRSASEEDGYLHAKNICRLLDTTVLRTGVALEAISYRVNSFNRTSPIICLGKESPESKRYLFTVNGLIALEQL
jgi:hypothetical protein